MTDYQKYLEENITKIGKEIEQLNEIVKISEKDIKSGNIGKIEVISY